MRYILMLAVVLSVAAFAAEPVVCSVSIGTGAATITSSPTSGTCSWGKGASVMVQCDQAIYVDSASGGTATSADQKIDFVSNSDPYVVHLDAADQHISLLAVSASGTCKFMTTKRRKPY